MIPTISTTESSELMPVKYVDSGFSETTTDDNDTTIVSKNILGDVLYVEQMYYEQLKENITKYSRPLRRYLSQQQILDLFQNVEKISAISESLVRHCEKLHDNNGFISISTIYKSWLPVDYVFKSLKQFITLPLKHLCQMNHLLHRLLEKYDYENNDFDIHCLEAIKLLAIQASQVLSSNDNSRTYIDTEDQTTDQDSTIQTNENKLIRSSSAVLQRVNREPWSMNLLELYDNILHFIQIDNNGTSSSSSISLENVIKLECNQIDEGGQIRLLLSKKSSRINHHHSTSSLKLMRVYIRFRQMTEYKFWYIQLNKTIQLAKDHSWTHKNELVL
ncbi:unnamed protein product [Didymodactylos carnosus]|uniref:DH domain-containing protein n=1 Tax=Didymodactylos carnosus TaxID=1234261 RepID=A0A814AFT4_9BILA|nr:unnamed protein product [Didymodactylos carnosus]CAF3692573.1 unnamed protein product [Didymodactylos carnosus]